MNQDNYLYDELLDACETAADKVHDLCRYTPMGEAPEREQILNLIKREIFEIDFSEYIINN